jgi:predicted MPP superfamily phosphohydrolase
LTWLAVAVALLAVAALAWGWFEAGWLRKRVVEVELTGLSRELDGLRIAHLSDFHLGVRSRGEGASEEAVAWVAERRPDIVCVTGDLVSRRRGVPLLRKLLGQLRSSYVVLGNHDFADSRDPFSERIDPAIFDELEGVTVLRDDAVVVDLRGRRVQLVGVEPADYARREARPQRLADPEADLRVLLCHFPGIARRVPAGAFHLVLAGHLHAGQIVVPLPGRKLGLAHLGARDFEGLYRYGTTVLHVSPGLGTTFIPFRFFARPEATELVLRSDLVDAEVAGTFSGSSEQSSNELFEDER